MNNLLASTAENAVVGLLTAVDGVAGAAIPDNPSEAITAEVTFCKDYTTKNGQFKAVIHVTVTQI